uniref:Fibrinogen C-terminal domain-containing protein n=1 Tax=Anopheles farauti TaxID=69004 RepID=A0A182QZ13_9DIPT
MNRRRCQHRYPPDSGTPNSSDGVFCGVLVSIPATTPADGYSSGFGFELLMARLEELEARVAQKLEQVQQTATLHQQQLEAKFAGVMYFLSKSIRQQQMELLSTHSGVYTVRYNTSMFRVFRDGSLEYGFGGNWTVFQRRFDGSVDFNRSWSDYRHGFGDVFGEHWLGLEKLKTIIDTGRHELLVVLEDFDGVIAYARYDNFRIAGESERYAIKSLGRYAGTAGNAMEYHLTEKFATYDRKDENDCAERFGGGEWFYNCYHARLNGPYMESAKLTKRKGIHWYEFRGHDSLKATKMMIRAL